MTASLRNPIRLRDPGDLIAAVPHLLGFHPIDSLVLVTLCGPRATRLGVTIRIDLPEPEHELELAHQLLQLAQRNEASAVVLVVLGGGSADAPALLPHRQLVAALGDVLPPAGVLVTHAVWAASTREGEWWCCYHEVDCAGKVPNPNATALAAATAAAGVVTFANREELAALLAPDTVAALARRSARITEVTSAAESDRALVDLAVARQDLLAVRAAMDAALQGRLVLDDEDVVRLAVALSDHHVRDACLATTSDEQQAAAEQLWLTLTRLTPPPERAEPAALLALSAYCRGDGALASIALEQAELAQPGHRLTELLRTALDTGLPPTRLSVLVANAAADAERYLSENDDE